MKGKVLYNWPDGYCEEKMRLSDMSLPGKGSYDVAIIGAGVVGCAIAYRLSCFDLNIILIDRNHDVGESTSKANSGIVHTGYDAAPGTLESELVTRSSRMWPELADKLKIPFGQISALMIALNEEQNERLPDLCEKSIKNGVGDIEIISADKVRELEPNVTLMAKDAIHVVRESIADLFMTSIAYSEVAVANGATILLGCDVVSIEAETEAIKTIKSKDGIEIKVRTIINAAGLGSARLCSTYDGVHYDINPRRGQFIIYDRLCSDLVKRIILPAPTLMTKGILVTPTIYGNLLAGPTAEDLPEDAIFDTGTTKEGIEKVKEGSRKLCPGLSNQPMISKFSGLRANCAQGSYQIRFNDGARGIISLNGIRSTGFTASIGIADYVIDGLQTHCGVRMSVKTGHHDSRAEEARPEWVEPRPFMSPEKIKMHSDYGSMVCFCEQISKQELINTLSSPLSPRTLDSIKRRTRAMMGRCQGYNCQIAIAEIISKHSGIPFHHITKKGPGSEIL